MQNPCKLFLAWITKFVYLVVVGIYINPRKKRLVYQRKAWKGKIKRESKNLMNKK